MSKVAMTKDQHSQVSNGLDAAASLLSLCPT